LVTRRVLVTDCPVDSVSSKNEGLACTTGGGTTTAAIGISRRAAFEASLAANRRDAATYVNLGVFHLQAGDPVRAAGYFAEALTIDPASAGARNGLAQARSAKP